MEITPTRVLVGVAIFAVLAFIGRMVKLFRQSRAIEKTLDYSKMKKWEDDDDDWK